MRVAPAALLLALAPVAAQAHAFGQRYDLPLPLGFYLGGAGLAVALSFLGSFAFRGGGGAWPSVRIPVPAWLVRAAVRAARALAIALLGMVMVTALLGPQNPTQNFATVFVWVIWWVGFVLFSALAVDLWSGANPFATFADVALRGHARSRPAPRWAPWLSVLGLIALSWTETVSEMSEDPRALAALIALYAAMLLIGAAWIGRETWFAAADPLTRLFSLLGALAPVALKGGAIEVRAPGAGLVGRPSGVAGAVFVVTLIAIVLFDGLSETPFWTAILDWITQSRGLRPWLLDLRDAGVDLLKLIRTLGLLSTIMVAIALYALLSLAIWAAGGREGTVRAIFTSFAPALLPIAVAYHLAHYVFYLALAGQLIVPATLDPFGLGWDVAGRGGTMLNAGVMTAQDVWWVAAAALVLGHAVSVLVAHAQALRLSSTRRRAVQGQAPMMAFMVTLTSLSLWILAQPVVQ
jgi:hypothetical protein